jgi:hypothetical protein
VAIAGGIIIVAVLASVLLDPVVARIDNKRLLIVTEGALHYLPFGALPEPGGDAR